MAPFAVPSREFLQRCAELGKILDEAAVIADHSEEGADVRLRRWWQERCDGRELLRVRRHAVPGDPMTQVDQLGGGEGALGELHGDSRTHQSVAELVEILHVLLEGEFAFLGEEQDVVQVDEALFPTQPVQDRYHHLCKRCRCIVQAHR